MKETAKDTLMTWKCKPALHLSLFSFVAGWLLRMVGRHQLRKGGDMVVRMMANAKPRPRLSFLGNVLSALSVLVFLATVALPLYLKELDAKVSPKHHGFHITSVVAYPTGTESYVTAELRMKNTACQITGVDWYLGSRAGGSVSVPNTLLTSATKASDPETLILTFMVAAIPEQVTDRSFADVTYSGCYSWTPSGMVVKDALYTGVGQDTVRLAREQSQQEGAGIALLVDSLRGLLGQ